MAGYVLGCESRKVSTLPKRYRITRRVGFSGILLQRPQIRAWFAVHTEKNQSGHARLGISVSKRLLPVSVQRNRVKRLIRESFRNLAGHGISLDVVVRLRKPLEIKDIPKARTSLDEMLESVLAVK